MCETRPASPSRSLAARRRDESREPRLAAFFDAVAVVLFVFAFLARYIIRVAARHGAALADQRVVDGERERRLREDQVAGAQRLVATAQRPRSGWDVTLNVSAIARTQNQSPADDLALLRGPKTREPFAW